MRNKEKLIFLYGLISFLLSPFSYAQQLKYSKTHGDTLINKKHMVDSKKEAMLAVENIVKYTGLIQNFQIVENPDIPTARARIRKKKRYIEYNPEFMLRVKDRTQSDWGAISVLAHEIGHHLAGHTLIKRRRNLQEEIDADRFSGFILHQMGATLEEAKASITLVELNSNPATHPAKTERLIAITLGWLDANNLEGRLVAGDTTVHLASFSEDTAKMKKKPFVYKCVIYGDRNYYFIDDKNQVVSIDDYGEPYVVGYKVVSHDKSFDWIFSVQSLTYGVDSKGKMWSKTYAGDMFIVGKVYNIPVK